MSRRVISAVLKLKDQNFANGLRKANKEAGDFGRYMQVAQNKAEDMSRKVSAGLKKVGVAAGALAATGVAALSASVASTMIDMETAFSDLQVQTGAAGSDLKNLESAAIQTFKKGYGESLSEVSAAVARVKQNMHSIDGSEIDSVTSKAMLLSSKFDSDVNEVTRGVNNTMEAFGVTADKAFDLFTTGGQRGLNFSNEMFDNVAEYAPLFGKMGYSAEQYFGILERGSKAGVYNLDYVNDIMKEFQIRTKDGSKTTGDAMAMMSKESQNVWKSFLNGKGTVADVASKVVGELQSMDDQVLANQIGVSLFGTKFEDLESDAVYAMLGTTAAMEEFTGSTDKAAQAVEGSFKNRLVSAWRTLNTNIASAASTGEGKEFMDSLAMTAESLVPKITNLAEKALEFGNGIRDNWGPIKETIIGITTAVVAFKVGMMAMSIVSTVTGFIKAYRAALAAGTVAQWAMNIAMNANPVGLVIAGIAALIGIGVVLYRNWDTVTAKTQKVWSSIGGLTGALRMITGPIGIVIGAAIDLAKNWDSTKSVWENVWGAMQRSAAKTVNSVVGGINEMIRTINRIPGVNIPLIAKVNWGGAAPKDINNVVSKTVGGGRIPEYAVGSNRINGDQFAMIHDEEMIIPARQAAKVRAAGGTIDNIDKLVAGRGKTIITSTETTNNTSTNSPRQVTFGDIIIQTVGSTAMEIVEEVVTMLKIRLANI